MPWTCLNCGAEAGMLGCSNALCIDQPTLLEELLAREVLVDHDEHRHLTKDIVEYLFKHFVLIRKEALNEHLSP